MTGLLLFVLTFKGAENGAIILICRLNLKLCSKETKQTKNLNFWRKSNSISFFSKLKGNKLLCRKTEETIFVVQIPMMPQCFASKRHDDLKHDSPSAPPWKR